MNVNLRQSPNQGSGVSEVSDPLSTQFSLVLFMLEYKSMAYLGMVKLQPFAVHKPSDIYCKACLK